MSQFYSDKGALRRKPSYGPEDYRKFECERCGEFWVWTISIAHNCPKCGRLEFDGELFEQIWKSVDRDNLQWL